MTGESKIRYNVYVTSGTLQSAREDPEGISKAVRRFKVAGIHKVILEGYRGGVVTEESLLVQLKRDFEEAGFQTAGGLMPVEGRGFGKRNVGVEIRAPFFCYSDAGTRKGLEQEIRKLARVFDEVIIDDAFLTGCQCAECEAGRGARDWSKFRQDLLAGLSQILVEAAHQENPQCRLILKLPQYYDRYHLFGYDPARQGQIFDGLWVGTETRDPDSLAYGYVEPYEAWFHVRWIQDCVGKKYEGAWFDFLDCDEQLFLEQAITTTLAQAKQITFFCYAPQIFGEETGMSRRIVACRDFLERLNGLSEKPAGVSLCRPSGSDGEGDLFLPDILGMMGIPLVPASRFPERAESLLIPRHGTSDPEAPRRILDTLKKGKQVILTSHALCGWRGNRELLQAFGYEPFGVGLVRSPADRIQIESQEIPLEVPILLPCDLQPNDAEVLAKALVWSCEGPGLEVPFVTVKRHESGGRAVVWNLGTFGHQAFPAHERLNVPEPSPLLRLPQPVLDFLRNQAMEPLRMSLSMPARVGAYLFSSALVLVNYTDKPVMAQWEGLNVDADSAFSDRTGNWATPERASLAPRSVMALPLRHA